MHNAPAGSIIQVINASTNTDLVQNGDSILDKVTLTTPSAGVQQIKVRYLGNQYPYLAKLKIKAPGYLMYNPQNGFIMVKVLFGNPGDWSGLGQKGQTSNVEESKEGNKRTGW